MYMMLALNGKGKLEARLYEGQYNGNVPSADFKVVVESNEQQQVANNIEGVLAALCRMHCRVQEIIIPMWVVSQTVGRSPDVRGYG